MRLAIFPFDSPNCLAFLPLFMTLLSRQRSETRSGYPTFTTIINSTLVPRFRYSVRISSSVGLHAAARLDGVSFRTDCDDIEAQTLTAFVRNRRTFCLRLFPFFFSLSTSSISLLRGLYQAATRGSTASDSGTGTSARYRCRLALRCFTSQ